MRKKSIVSLFGIVALLAVTATSISMAATIEVGNNGALRTSPATSWQNIGVVVPPDVLAYGNAWKEAYRHPGMVVPIRTHPEYSRDGLFHIRKTQIVDVGIIYNAKESAVRVVRNIALTHQNTFTSYFGIWLVTMLLWFFIIRKIRKARNDADREKISGLGSILMLLMVFEVISMFFVTYVTNLPLATIGAIATVAATLLVILYAIENLPKSPLMGSVVAFLMAVSGALFLTI